MADPVQLFTWTDARVLMADARADEAAVRQLLPEALRLATPATISIFVADYPKTAFGSIYREAGILIHVEHDDGPAVHCPWMVVDDDTALILGREMLGFPKKLADISLETRETFATGSVVRKGTEIICIEAELGAAEPAPAPVFGRRIVNVIGNPVTGMQLLELPPTREDIHGSRVGTAKISLGKTDRDPLADLAVAPDASVRLIDLDFGGGGTTSGTGLKLRGPVDAAWQGRELMFRIR